MNAVRPVRFVGADFERWPYLSGIGTLLRVSRLNCYEARDYRFAFGITVRRQDDLSSVMAFSDKRKEQLANALLVPATARQAWDLPYWLPFHCEEAVLAKRYAFRYCPTCLRHAYHTLLHQLPWIGRCPWHGDRLRSTCLKCGIPLHVNGTQETWLGICKCGYDHVDDKAAIRGLSAGCPLEPICRCYLDWAADMREHTVLIAPFPAAHSIGVLSDAFQLPQGLAWRSKSGEAKECARVHRALARPEASRRSGTEDAVAAFIKLDCLQDLRAAMIEAPGRLAVRIAQIAYRLACQLPPGSLSDGEMTLFLNPVGAEASGNFVPARRRSVMEISSLPLAKVGARSYLDLHCISQITRLVGHHVLQQAKSGLPAGPDQYRNIPVERLGVALSAAYEILARGYSEGIRIAIGHHVPELYGTRRNRPHLSEPWVLVNRDNGTRYSMEIFWARLAHIPD